MFFAATSPPRLVTLILLTGLSTLSLNMFLPSLPNIADAFAADYGLVSLSIAGYLAVTSVLQLVAGPLSDRFGRRPVLLIGLVIFLVASLGCLFATNIWAFLGFRMLQAAVISGAVLSSAIIRDTVPAQKAVSLLGYVNMAMAIAPMLGPMIGGTLDEFFGWRANFVAYSGAGLLVLILCWVDLGETNTNRSETFGAQLASYPSLFRSGIFWGYALCRAFSICAFYVFIAGLPLVTRTLFAMSTQELGFYMGTITIGFFLGSFLSGRFASRFSLLTLILTGRVFACAGLSIGLVFFLMGYVHVLLLFGATIFVGFGNGLTLPSATVGLMSVKPELAGSASGLGGALITGSGALFTLVTSMILTEANGVYALLGMMLFSATMALLAALYVASAEKKSA